MFPEISKAVIKKEEEKAVYNGNPLKAEQLRGKLLLQDEEKIRVYTEEGQFLALYRFRVKEKIYKVEKMFYSPQ